MSKQKLERGIIPALILFVICMLATAALAGTHEMTKDVIAERVRAAMEENKRELFPDATEFKAVEAPEGADVLLAEAAYDNAGNIIGYFFQTAAKGYGGLIQTYTGIKADGTISGVIFGENEETPGFGKKIEQDWFMDNFKGKSANSFFVTKSSGDSATATADADSSATGEAETATQDAASSATSSSDSETAKTDADSSATQETETEDAHSSATEETEATTADAESSATQVAAAGTEEVVIDMISGATVSSNGACKAVNQATEAYRGLTD